MTEHESNAASRAQHGAREDREERSTDTVPTGSGSGIGSQEDVLSDPARDDRLGSDWADEGGATAAGPATSTPAGEEQGDDPKRRDHPDLQEEEREESGGNGRASSGSSQPPISLDPPD